MLTDAIIKGSAVPTERPRSRRAWTEYVRAVTVTAVFALAFAGGFRLVGWDILPFTQLVGLRTAFTFFVWLYFALTLFAIGRKFEVIAIATIPFLAQFYQVALGRDFPQGPGTVRSAPYLIMALAMALAIARRRWRPSASEGFVLGAAGIVALLGFVRGIHLTTAALPAAFYVGVLLPLFYGYVQALAHQGGGRLDELLLSLTLGALLLMFGFFIILQLGMRVETVLGFGSSDSAMNAADFNALAGYLLLLWPFALTFAARRSRLLVAALVVLLLATVYAGLSRTMLFLTPPLVLASIPACLPRATFRNTLALLLSVGLAAVVALWSLNQLGLASWSLFRWQQRLDLTSQDVRDISLENLTASVSLGSRSWQIRAAVRQQGWDMFWANPLVGQGWGTFPYFSRVGLTSAHSLTIDIIAQTGLFGGVLLWGLILLAFGRLTRGVSLHPTAIRSSVMFVAAFLLWLVAAHTLGAQMFAVAEESFTTGALTGLLFVLYLSRGVVNHTTLSPAI